MSDQDFAIYQRMLDTNGSLYVTPNRQKIYHIFEGKMYIINGDFQNMDDKAINQVVCVALNHC